MYRVIKPLNNNGLLALTEDGQEVILLGKGIGFGRKNGERLTMPPKVKVYSLVPHRAGSALQTVNSIDPRAVEMAARVLDEARKDISGIADDILLPMADHIAMAVERQRRGIRLPNPLQHDIMAMFPDEFRAAKRGLLALQQEFGTELPLEEAGYLTLHIHAGLSSETAGESLSTLQLASRCVRIIEESLGRELPRANLKYTRLISHVCYMLLRIKSQEGVPVHIDDYIQQMYPDSYALAEKVGNFVQQELSMPVPRAEVTLLALHIQRVI